MAILGNNYYKLTVVGEQGGQLCYTNMGYSLDQRITLPGRTVAEAWVTSFINTLRQFMSPQFRVLELRYASAFNQGTGFVNINLPGTWATSQVLPPNVTASFMKVFDQISQEGAGAKLMQRGRLSWSGIPEDIQDNGVVTDSAWLGGMELLMTDIIGFSVTYLAQNYPLLMIGLRPPVPPSLVPEKVAYVDALPFSLIGTQNTRKRQ